MPELLLVGGTGLLGSEIARRLAGRGVPFRALVRPRTDAARLESLGAGIVRGDLTEPSTLLPALSGISTVVTTANAIGRMMAGATDVSIQSVDRRGNEALIRAAEAAGVQRFVFVSVSDLSPAMVRRAPLMAAKADVERVLAASPMPSVIVRPAAFQEVWLSPAVGIQPDRRRAIIYGRGRTPWPYVALGDVAEACVRLALVDEPPSAVDFGGPERLTRHEVVDAFERFIGARFRRVTVPRPVLAAGCRLLRTAKPEVASVMGLALTSDEEESRLTDRPLRELGIEPRSTTETIERMVRTSSTRV
jgi:NADH dehydrogenase